MTRLFLHIYDFLSKRKALAFGLLALIVAGLALLVVRLDYEEDISAFLPKDPRSARLEKLYSHIGDQGQVVVLFHHPEADIDAILDAVDDFGRRLPKRDTLGCVAGVRTCTSHRDIFEVMDFVLGHAPYFLDEADYARIDSLLRQSDYLVQSLEAGRQSLLIPTGGMMEHTLTLDPLRLFTPLLTELQDFGASELFHQVDGYVMTQDNTRGLAFVSTPYGLSESRQNDRLEHLLTQVCAEVEAAHPGVTISSIGAPVIAVGNARQIKQDSLLAVAIALVLIVALLLYAFRRVADMGWMLVSIGFGLLFAVGGLALFNDRVSIIILGLGSIIIGIAANYPIHYLDYLRQQHSPREALKDIIQPLVIGNVTSVAAFLSLVFLKAPAMRALGAFGGLMLIGTILFVVIFLPLMAGSGRVETGKRANGQAGTTAKAEEPRLAFRRLASLSPERIRLSLIPVLTLSVVLWYMGRDTGFDGDMNHINYLTPRQQQDLQYLGRSLEKEGCDLVYAVAEGQGLDAALQRHEALLRQLDENHALAAEGRLRGVGRFLPSTAEQTLRLQRWEEFRQTWGDYLLSRLPEEAANAGFYPGVFEGFLSLLRQPAETLDPTDFGPVLSQLAANYWWEDSDGCCYVNNFVYVEKGQAEAFKASVEEKEGSYLFDTGDISHQLVNVLSDSFDYIGTVCSLIVFLFLWLSFGRLELSLTAFLPLALSWVWILGLMDLFSLQFNIVNVILATFIFGQGDDYTIFITEGLMYEYTYGRRQVASYKNSVILSALIMFVGIGALIVSRHPAMHSLAALTIIGMVTVVAMAYYLPPLIYRWLTATRLGLREVPLTLARFIRSFGAISFFVLSAVVVLPVTAVYALIGSRKDSWRLSYHRLIQAYARFVIYRVPGCRFRFDNLSGEPVPDEPVLYLCNHQSHLDLMCVLMLTPKLVILTKDWVWNNPLYGFIIRFCQFYPITHGPEDSLEHLKPLVEKGYSVVIFPEGTRSVDGRIQRFHQGAFYLAEQLGLDIMPLFLHGPGQALPKKDFMLRRSEMRLEMAPRIRRNDTAWGQTYQERRSRVMDYYRLHYDEIRRHVPTPLYWDWLVRHKYLYKGRDIEQAARRTLKRVQSEDFRQWETQLAALVPGGVCRLERSGRGELAWRLALAWPDIEFYGLESDPDLHDIAAHTPCPPANLHFASDGTPDLPDADLSITLNPATEK